MPDVVICLTAALTISEVHAKRKYITELIKNADRKYLILLTRYIKN